MHVLQVYGVLVYMPISCVAYTYATHLRSAFESPLHGDIFGHRLHHVFFSNRGVRAGEDADQLQVLHGRHQDQVGLIMRYFGGVSERALTSGRNSRRPEGFYLD